MTIEYIPPDRVTRIQNAIDLALRSKSELLSRREAAAYLGVTPETLAVWHSLKRYGIPVVKVGRLAKYRKSDLDAFIQSRIVAG